MKLGRNVGHTFLDYYKLMGVISSKPSSGVAPKSVRQTNKERELAGGLSKLALNEEK